MCSGAFGFLGPRLVLGTASSGSAVAAGFAEDDAGTAFGGCLLALKEEIKSTARGESPSMLEKCATASSLERVAA